MGIVASVADAVDPMAGVIAGYVIGGLLGLVIIIALISSCCGKDNEVAPASAGGDLAVINMSGQQQAADTMQPPPYATNTIDEPQYTFHEQQPEGTIGTAPQPADGASATYPPSAGASGTN